MIVESYEDVIILSGALKSNFWHTVHTAISLSLKRAPQGVIIDCSQITECSREGADTFRDILGFLEKHEARVIVAAVPRHVMTVLKDVPEVRSQLPIAETVEVARASLFRLALPADDGKKRKKSANLTRFMVVLTGCPSDRYALQIACEHAKYAQADLVLMAPVIVPRELPLQAPLMEEETEAERVLSAGLSFCDEEGVHATRHIERGRDVASTIDDALAEEESGQVILGLPFSAHNDDSASKLVKAVLAKVARPLMFVRDRAE